MAESFDNLGFQKTKKVAVFKTKIVISSIAMVNVNSLLIIWKEMTWNILNLEFIEFYICTLWEHNGKFLIKAKWETWWMPNDCVLLGIDETKSTTFAFMKNDVVQINLV